MIARADELGLDRLPVGGISLGAGTAHSLAMRYPDRVSGLVLCRPAWLEHPQPEPNPTPVGGAAALTRLATIVLSN